MISGLPLVLIGGPASADSQALAQPQPSGKMQSSGQTQSSGQKQSSGQPQSSGQTQSLQTQSSGRTHETAPVVASATDNLETSLRELHESLRRMKGDIDDILHEVTRTEQVYNNGVPVSSNPWSQSPNYLINGGMVAQDALSHNVYLPPRTHWLDNSLAQLHDLQPKLQAETANITKLLGSPECNSATRAQGFVLSDITAELGKDLDGLQALIREEQPSNAKINVNAHKIVDTISGMDNVGDRLWKEAPRGLKAR
jgi:hypothetical protein